MIVDFDTIALLVSIISGLTLITIYPSEHKTEDVYGKENVHKGFVTIK